MRLIQKADSKENNFHFLRFLAAALVIFSHSYPLSGSKFEPFAWLVQYNTFGGLAVNIFFLISGFLITKSWLDNPNIFQFSMKRILRIMPAFIVAIFFSVFVVGPLVTNLSFKEYIVHPFTKLYLMNVFMFPIHYNLPGVFVNNPYPNAVNGSLWSLPVELIMYGLVAVLGLLRVFSKS